MAPISITYLPGPARLQTDSSQFEGWRAHKLPFLRSALTNETLVLTDKERKAQSSLLGCPLVWLSQCRVGEDDYFVHLPGITSDGTLAYRTAYCAQQMRFSAIFKRYRGKLDNLGGETPQWWLEVSRDSALFLKGLYTHIGLDPIHDPAKTVATWSFIFNSSFSRQIRKRLDVGVYPLSVMVTEEDFRRVTSEATLSWSRRWPHLLIDKEASTNQGYKLIRTLPTSLSQDMSQNNRRAAHILVRAATPGAGRLSSPLTMLVFPSNPEDLKFLSPAVTRHFYPVQNNTQQEWGNLIRTAVDSCTLFWESATSSSYLARELKRFGQYASQRDPHGNFVVAAIRGQMDLDHQNEQGEQTGGYVKPLVGLVSATEWDEALDDGYLSLDPLETGYDDVVNKKICDEIKRHILTSSIPVAATADLPPAYEPVDPSSIAESAPPAYDQPELPTQQHTGSPGRNSHRIGRAGGCHPQ